MSKYIISILFLCIVSILFHSETNSQETGIEQHYTILSDSDYLHYKRSVDVKLKRRVSEATLKKIAQKIKAMERKQYERTFIMYFHPEMPIGTAWATTHYDPTLKVQILGATEKQKSELIKTAKAKCANREVMGIRFAEFQYMSQSIVMFKEGSKFLLDVTYKDGSGGITELKRKKTRKGFLYHDAFDDEYFEYYIINSEGNLELRDEYDIIFTGRKINQ